jgi:hypothetical protein
MRSTAQHLAGVTAYSTRPTASQNRRVTQLIKSSTSVLFAAALRWRYRGRSFGFAIDGVRIVLPQVLDDGRLTDGQGRTVDFRNTLIVLTSNLGSEALASLPDGADVSVARAAVMAAVRDAFRPEFLNRLDEILLFRRLSRDGDRRNPARAPETAARRSQDHLERSTLPM